MLISGVVEIVSTLLSRRAKHLKSFIVGLLKDSGLSVTDFYAKTVITPQIRGETLPAYIRAADFAGALFTLLRTKLPDESFPEQRDITFADIKGLIPILPSSAPLRAVLSTCVDAATHESIRAVYR